MTGLKTESVGYKPFRYPWAFDFWQQQQRVHWLPEEVPMAEDVKDWREKLTDDERNFMTQIFRLFTQSDIDVNDNYMENYGRIFKPVEIKMMLSAFSNIETVHIAAYSNLVETVGMPETLYSEFMEYESMKAKHDLVHSMSVDTDADILKTMAVVGGFVEGLQLFASFAMLLNFPRFNKMKGMGQIVTWSIRDESLHCEGIIRLFHEFAKETGALTEELKEEIRTIAQSIVANEDKFIDLAFGLGSYEGITPEDIKKYIRYVADWRLSQLGLQPVYGIEEHPLPWLLTFTNGIEHANFFEQRATEYSKSATVGNWPEVWDFFDKKKS